VSRPAHRRQSLLREEFPSPPPQLLVPARLLSRHFFFSTTKIPRFRSIFSIRRYFERFFPSVSSLFASLPVTGRTCDALDPVLCGYANQASPPDLISGTPFIAQGPCRSPRFDELSPQAHATSCLISGDPRPPSLALPPIYHSPFFAILFSNAMPAPEVAQQATPSVIRIPMCFSQ